MYSKEKSRGVCHMLAILALGKLMQEKGEGREGRRGGRKVGKEGGREKGGVLASFSHSIVTSPIPRSNYELTQLFLLVPLKFIQVSSLCGTTN